MKIPSLLKHARKFANRHRVAGGEKFRLKDHDTDETGG